MIGALGKGTAVGTLLETSPMVVVSSNPLSRKVLAAAGLAFHAVEPWIEGPTAGAGALTPAQRAEALAYFRARAVAQRRTDATILGITTLVAVGDRLFGKPFGRFEAAEMLRAVSGTRHDVVTGVVLLRPPYRLIASDVTRVRLTPIPEEAIREHLASGDWLGVPGAYATPELADRYVVELEGSFSNLLGMPVELVTRMVAELRQHPELHRCDDCAA